MTITAKPVPADYECPACEGEFHVADVWNVAHPVYGEGHVECPYCGKVYFLEYVWGDDDEMDYSLILSEPIRQPPDTMPSPGGDR